VEERRRDEHLTANLIYNLTAVNSILNSGNRNSIAFTASINPVLPNGHTIIIITIINRINYKYFHNKRKKLQKL